MLRAMSTAQAQTKYMTIICVGGFIVLNIGFYFLSAGYFDSHTHIEAGRGSVPNFSPAQVMHVRVEFALFSGIVAGAGFAAGIWPRIVGHLIPMLLATLQLIASVAAFWHTDVPRVVGVTLVVSGVLMPVLARASYYDRSRPAWAILITICGVFGVVEFFGAPKVRGALDVALDPDIGLWITMILPGLSAVAVAALASLRGEYVERDAVAG